MKTTVSQTIAMRSTERSGRSGVWIDQMKRNPPIERIQTRNGKLSQRNEMIV